MRQNQGGPSDGLNDFGHGESFAGTGHAEQCLMLLAFQKSAVKLFNGGRPGRRAADSRFLT